MCINKFYELNLLCTIAAKIGYKGDIPFGMDKHMLQPYRESELIEENYLGITFWSHILERITTVSYLLSYFLNKNLQSVGYLLLRVVLLVCSWMMLTSWTCLSQVW